ncbi:MAG: outer membrane lipoprotein carrier protein LolA [Candidatus Lernaella stagnicola]|nr:outer membrane lipoprotein carrier protein LolA [Candidatus Lernaella stagnicola]
MRRVIVLTLLLSLTLCSGAWALDLNGVLAGVKARYSKAKDLTVDFEQVAKIKQLGNREKKAHGTIYLARPDKMRWVYKSPPVKEIITDGASLVIYYADEKKAYLDMAGKTFNVAEPIKILSGDIDLKHKYEAELLPEEDGRARIKLTPRRPMGFAHLVLHIEPKTFYVRRVDTVDAYGNVTRISLSTPRFNVNLPESTFVYTPQEGVEIIDAPMMDGL